MTRSDDGRWRLAWGPDGTAGGQRPAKMGNRLGQHNPASNTSRCRFLTWPAPLARLNPIQAAPTVKVARTGCFSTYKSHTSYILLGGTHKIHRFRGVSYHFLPAPMTDLGAAAGACLRVSGRRGTRRSCDSRKKRREKSQTWTRRRESLQRGRVAPADIVQGEGGGIMGKANLGQQRGVNPGVIPKGAGRWRESAEAETVRSL